MTEATTEPSTATEPSTETATIETKPTETVDFWKQKAREQEKRAKDNADAATRLAALEDANKTETQRLTETADAAQKRAEAAEAQAIRLEVAFEKGLTPAQAKRLVGNTREELESDADDLLENFKAPATETQQPSTALDLDLGQRGTTASQSADQDAAKWLQSIVRK